jgi:hypothetical protein
MNLGQTVIRWFGLAVENQNHPAVIAGAAHNRPIFHNAQFARLATLSVVLNLMQPISNLKMDSKMWTLRPIFDQNLGALTCRLCPNRSICAVAETTVVPLVCPLTI